MISFDGFGLQSFESTLLLQTMLPAFLLPASCVTSQGVDSTLTTRVCMHLHLILCTRPIVRHSQPCRNSKRGPIEASRVWWMKYQSYQIVEPLLSARRTKMFLQVDCIIIFTPHLESPNTRDAFKLLYAESKKHRSPIRQKRAGRCRQGMLSKCMNTSPCC